MGSPLKFLKGGPSVHSIGHKSLPVCNQNSKTIAPARDSNLIFRDCGFVSSTVCLIAPPAKKKQKNH